MASSIVRNFRFLRRRTFQSIKAIHARGNFVIILRKSNDASCEHRIQGIEDPNKGDRRFGKFSNYIFRSSHYTFCTIINGSWARWQKNAWCFFYSGRKRTARQCSRRRPVRIHGSSCGAFHQTSFLPSPFASFPRSFFLCLPSDKLHTPSVPYHSDCYDVGCTVRFNLANESLVRVLFISCRFLLTPRPGPSPNVWKIPPWHRRVYFSSE